MFWPNLHSSSLHLTPKLEQVQTEYETAFHHFKPDKRLRWLQEMGKVTITLELEDREVTVDATPLQAAVAELFEGQARWSEEALGDKLGVDGVPLRSALAHWVGHGVLKEDDDGMWRLLEVVEEAGEKCKWGAGLGETKERVLTVSVRARGPRAAVQDCRRGPRPTSPDLLELHQGHAEQPRPAEH